MSALRCRLFGHRSTPWGRTFYCRWCGASWPFLAGSDTEDREGQQP